MLVFIKKIARTLKYFGGVICNDRMTSLYKTIMCLLHYNLLKKKNRRKSPKSKIRRKNYKVIVQLFLVWLLVAPIFVSLLYFCFATKVSKESLAIDFAIDGA